MPATKTARNPKIVRFTISLDEGVNRRLERIADMIGQNKSVAASVTLAAGLRMMEAMAGIEHEADQHRKEAEVQDTLRGMQDDVKQTAEALRVTNKE